MSVIDSPGQRIAAQVKSLVFGLLIIALALVGSPVVAWAEANLTIDGSSDFANDSHYFLNTTTDGNPIDPEGGSSGIVVPGGVNGFLSGANASNNEVNVTALPGGSANITVLGGANTNETANDGNVSNNVVNVHSGGTHFEINGSVIGGYSNVTTGTANARHNKVNMEGVTVGGKTVGGLVTANGKAFENEVNVTNSTLRDDVIGGKSDNGTNYLNKAHLNNSVALGNVYGGSGAVVYNNTVSVHGSNINKSVVGGHSEGFAGDPARQAVADNNSVAITGASNVTEGPVAGGRIAGATLDGSVKGNRVEVDNEGGNLKDVYGGYTTSEVVGEISGNEVDFKNGQAESVMGAYSAGNSTSMVDNKVNFKGGEADNVYGGKVDGLPGATDSNVSRNIVNVTGGKINDTVYGGYVGSTNNALSENEVYISGGAKVKNVYGGYAANNAEVDVTNNKVVINNGNVSGDVTGGRSSVGHADNNTVEISHAREIDNVYGGYSVNSTADGNKISLNNVTISGNVYGGFSENASVLTANNSIVLNGTNIAGSIYVNDVASGDDTRYDVTYVGGVNTLQSDLKAADGLLINGGRVSLSNDNGFGWGTIELGKLTIEGLAEYSYFTNGVIVDGDTRISAGNNNFEFLLQTPNLTITGGQNNIYKFNVSNNLTIEGGSTTLVRQIENLSFFNLLGGTVSFVNDNYAFNVTNDAIINVDSEFNNDFNVGNLKITGGYSDFRGDLRISGILATSDDASFLVWEKITLDGLSLNSSGYGTFYGDVAVAHDANISNGVNTFAASLNATDVTLTGGKTAVEGDLNALGTLATSGASNITVDGTSTLGNLSLGSTGTSVFEDRVTVAENSIISAGNNKFKDLLETINLTITDGETTFMGNVNVSNDTIIINGTSVFGVNLDAGNLKIFGGDTYINHNLTSSGILATSNEANIDIYGTTTLDSLSLDSSGEGWFDMDVAVAHDANISNGLNTFYQSLSATDVTLTGGDTSIGNDLNASGTLATSGASNLTVNGTSTLGNLSLGSTKNVFKKAVKVGGDTTISAGTNYFDDILETLNLTITGGDDNRFGDHVNVFNDAIIINGSSIFYANLNAGNLKLFGGDTHIFQNLTSSGILATSNDANIYIYGPTTLDSLSLDSIGEGIFEHDVAVAHDANISAGRNDFNKSLSATDVTLTGGDTSIANDLNALGTLATSGASNITVGGTSTLGNLSLGSSGTGTFGAVAVTDDASVSNGVNTFASLNATDVTLTGGDTSVSGDLNALGTLATDANANVNVSGTTNVAGLSLGSSGTGTFGAVAVDNDASVSDGLNTFDSLSANDVTLTGGDTSIANDLDATGTLATSNDANITVSGVTTLNDLNLDSSGYGNFGDVAVAHDANISDGLNTFASLNATDVNLAGGDTAVNGDLNALGTLATSNDANINVSGVTTLNDLNLDSSGYGNFGDVAVAHDANISDGINTFNSLNATDVNLAGGDTSIANDLNALGTLATSNDANITVTGDTTLGNLSLGSSGTATFGDVAVTDDANISNGLNTFNSLSATDVTLTGGDTVVNGVLNALGILDTSNDANVNVSGAASLGNLSLGSTGTSVFDDIVTVAENTIISAGTNIFNAILETES
ncbi:MAG: hypothetical protein LBS60_15670, partial [Deltaproteobacteria bacterium]|nr:hypothetical protein [Deltaproteobacteria bacterium]